jgi:hypothetical protein
VPFGTHIAFDHALHRRNSVARSLDRFSSIASGRFQKLGGIEMFASERHLPNMQFLSSFRRSLLLKRPTQA